MSAYSINEREGVVVVMSAENKVVAEFNTKDDLPRALTLLKKFNELKTKDGNYLSKIFKIEGYEAWSFNQEILFWSFFRYFSKYEELIKYLNNAKFDRLIIQKASADLNRIIENIFAGEVVLIEGRSMVANFFRYFIFTGTKFLAMIISLLAVIKLFLKKVPIIVYSPDILSSLGCDFRIYPLYSYLRDKQKDFIEVMHTDLGKNFLLNLIKRKKTVIYLDSFSWFVSPIKIGEVDLDITEELYVKIFFRSLVKNIAKRISISFNLFKKLDWIIRNSSLKTLVALDDVRYTNELIIACHKNGVKSFGLQHGQYTKYHVGWMNYGLSKKGSVTFDKLFVWNDYWKKILLNFSTQYGADNVSVGGWLRRLPQISYIRRPIPTSVGDLNILIPYEIALSGDENKKYVRRLLKMGINLFFKIRPDISKEKQLNDYGFSPVDNITVVDNINSGVLEKIDAIMGEYSTFLSEMIYYEIPIIQIQSSFDLGHYLKDDNLAIQLEKDFSEEKLLAALKKYSSKKDIVWPVTPDINLLFDRILC